MTKVGEGGHIPREQTKERYRRDLDKSAGKFLKALEIYHTTSDEGEKGHQKGVMDEQLRLIRATTQELMRAGMHKEESRVEGDYRAYLNGHSEEAFAALKHDLMTLCEYNRLI